MKKTTMKKRFGILAMVLSLVLSPIFQLQSFAAEEDTTEEVATGEGIGENDSGIMPRAGTETLPLGEYSIGKFTFYGWNTTPVKTIPAGASTISFRIWWKGDYNVSPRTQLYFQIRDTNGNALSPMYSSIDEYYPYDPGFVRFTQLTIRSISVSPGQKIQLYFRTDNDPSGSERKADILSFVSYIQ